MTPPKINPPSRLKQIKTRDEIAGCIEKAYEKILFPEATRILFFTTAKKMTDYAKKVPGGGPPGAPPGPPRDAPKTPRFGGGGFLLCFPQRGWVLGPNNSYTFGTRQPKAEDATIPSTELAKQVIEYARQLEMIV